MGPLRVQAGSPKTRTSPDCGFKSPSAHLRSVVLPAPFFPSRPTTEPSGTSNDRLSSTNLLPKYLVTSTRLSTDSAMIELLKGGIHEGADFFRREGRGPRPGRQLVDQTDDLGPAVALFTSNGRSGDTHALPADELHDAVAFQERVRFGDGHGIDGQLGGDVADRGKKITDEQP